MASPNAPRISADDFYGSTVYEDLPPGYISIASSSLPYEHEASSIFDRLPSDGPNLECIRVLGPGREIDLIVRFATQGQRPTIHHAHPRARIRSQTAEVRTTAQPNNSAGSEDLSPEEERQGIREPSEPIGEMDTSANDESQSGEGSSQSAGSSERPTVSSSSTTFTGDTSAQLTTSSTPSASQSTRTCRRCSVRFKCARWLANMSQWCLKQSRCPRLKRPACRECAWWFASTSYRCSDQSCGWNPCRPSWTKASPPL